MKSLETPQQAYVRRWGLLDGEYSTWLTRHQEVMQYLQPYRGRFTMGEQNRQTRKDKPFIVNDTGQDSQKKLAAAMSTGITSSAREWFRLTCSDPELDEDPEVRDYCHEWQDVLFHVFAQSNFYKVLDAVYMDLVGPGTTCAFIEEDDRDVIRAVHRPMGGYRLAVDARGRVDTVFERFSMTVAQVVDEFGLDNCSQWVKDQYDAGNYDVWVGILRIVEPRRNRQYGKKNAPNMPWASCWLEWNSQGSVAGNNGAVGSASLSGIPDKFLRESGYPEQPFIAPRWDVVGEDAYGSDSPGMQCIGDVKGLQALEKASAHLVAHFVEPSKNSPASLANSSLIPGSRNQLPGSAKEKVEPAYVPHPQAVTVAAEEKRQLEMRIRRCNYADLLRVLSSDMAVVAKTAEEIRAVKEERLLQLGGVAHRFNDEGLVYAIDRTWAIGQRKRLGPPPPRKLIEAARAGGKLFKIEMQNIFAAAQKTIGITALERLVAEAGNLRTIGRADALDKLNVDNILDAAADMLGTKPDLLLSADQVAQVRAARQQQQQAAAAGAAAVNLPPALKTLSETDPEKLRQVLGSLPPAAVAAGVGNGA